MGTSAVERTLISNRRNATVSLHVLPNTGCFLRLESCGHLEMWSIRQCKCLCTLSADIGDPIISCCPLLNSPFVLLGLGSGTLQCCAMVNAAGEHVGPARPIEGLQWMPFTVSTADIHIPDDSELQYVTSMQRCDGEFRVLLLHELHTVTAMSLASGEVCPCSFCMHLHFQQLVAVPLLYRCCPSMCLTASTLLQRAHHACSQSLSQVTLSRRTQGTACRCLRS